MIKINNLIKTYKLEEQDFTALSSIDLNIHKGEFVVILGQSGCGKSTLLNILGGMDSPTKGIVEINDENLSKKKPDDLAKYRREEVGMIFQKFNLINDATVLENVKMPLKFSGKNNADQDKIAKNALEKVSLTEKLKSLPKKLSGGQQQRVAIARALVNNPKIILCDEPTGNLDSKTGQDILNLLEKLNKQGYTIVMVTHNEAYTSYANRVVKMLDGKIISNKTNDTKKIVQKNIDDNKTKNINFLSKFGLAYKNLKRRKLRFFLTSFGIAIGAMTIVILVSFGAGLQKEVFNQMQSFSQVEEIKVTGEKVTDINFSMGGADFAKTEVKKLNDKTITDLEKIDNVEDVYPEIDFNGMMTYGNKTSIVYASSMTPVKYIKQELKDKIVFGAFPNSDDDNGVVIPYAQAVALGFDDPSQAVGKEVKIKTNDEENEFNAKITGVAAQKEKMFYSTLIPINTVDNWYKQIKKDQMEKTEPDIYKTIIARADDPAHVTEIKNAVDEKGYGASSYEDIAKQMSRLFLIMQIVMGVVGGIALLVASLGIINTMVMSVLERTKEIGVMKAVGARNKDISAIFLTEASLIGLFGGVIGLILGILGSKVIQSIVNTYLVEKSASSAGNELTFYVSIYLAAGVILFSILVSSLAGYFPSKRAAKLDPAEALREE